MRKNDTDKTPTDGGATAAPELLATSEPMLTPEQVADLLQISKATLCRLTNRGEIPHKRIGRRIVRYHRNEIEKWIKTV